MPVSLSAIVAQYRWPLLAALVLGYVASLVIYRRFFHPLARVPGPFLPAVTKFYQTYYNGQYYKEIARMHEIYGPVVRITPNEVHLSDWQNYDRIYFVGSKYAKSGNFYGGMCVPASTFGTESNEVHRIRRGAINPMFSRKMVLELEAVVQDKAQKVCRLTQRGLQAGTPVDLHHAFRAVSVDVISDFAFNKSYDFLDRDDLGAYFFRTLRGVGPGLWIFQQFPTIRDIAMMIPWWLSPYISPELGNIAFMQQECVNWVEDVKKRLGEGTYTERQTIFSTLLTDGEDKPEGYVIPSTMDLKDEAYSILAAAADTTGNAMTIAAYNVMSTPRIYKKLIQELEEAFPDASAQLSFVKLEKLPYLTGVVKEALRLSFGVIGRLPRVVPYPGETFNGHFIPGGMIVGMSSWLMHRNPEVFPDPMKFEPERWLNQDDFRRLEKHMVPFGRGTRGCLGMPLAYCETYLTLGTLFRRFHNLEVYKTTPADLQYDDFFSSYHIPGNWLKAVGRASEKSTL